MRKALALGAVALVAMLVLSIALQRASAATGIRQWYVGKNVEGCQGDFPTIQGAVDAASPGDTILICAGTYDEQVTISKPLTLMGLYSQGYGVQSVVIKPTQVHANTDSLYSGAPIAAIVLVDRTTDVTILDVTIDGSAGAFNSCSPGYVGIFYRASSGMVRGTHVTNIFHPQAPGCQSVIGIFVQSGNGGSGLNSDMAIVSNTVDNYGKNGITANEPGTHVTVVDNTVTGRGHLQAGEAAQNGVQIAFGAHGLVAGNTIERNWYEPEDSVACGILYYHSGGGMGHAGDNVFNDNEQNVCNSGKGMPKG